MSEAGSQTSSTSSPDSISTDVKKMSEESNIQDLDDEKLQKMSIEHYRLSGRKPLVTILTLSVGPILAQFTGSLKGIIGSIWVSKALGETALSAMSTIGVYDGISRSFGFFLSSAASSKISQLYGQKREEEAGQVVTDMIRLSVLFGIVVPLVLGLTTVPLSKWLGADEEVQDLCYQYMLPINVGTFTTMMFIALGGSLQGEGRSMFFSVMNIISLIANMCVLDPILLLALKTDIWGASFAQAFSEAVPAVMLLIMYYMGKFGVKPSLKQFIRKFSPHTGPALKVGMSQLIANLSQIVPSILVRKLMGLAFGSRFNDGMAALNTVVRFFIVTSSVIIAITMGYVPPASYSYARSNYKRWYHLSLHAFWLTFAWGSFTAILTWAIPKELSSMFASSEGYLEICTPMLKYSNALGFIVGGRFCGVAYLQSMQRGIQSTILSLLSHFISIIAFSFILYYTDKTDGVRIIWCYSLSHAFGLIMSIFFLIEPLKNMYHKYKEQNSGLEKEFEDNYLESESEKETRV